VTVATALIVGFGSQLGLDQAMIDSVVYFVVTYLVGQSAVDVTKELKKPTPQAPPQVVYDVTKELKKPTPQAPPQVVYVPQPNNAPAPSPTGLTPTQKWP